VKLGIFRTRFGPEKMFFFHAKGLVVVVVLPGPLPSDGTETTYIHSKDLLAGICHWTM